MATKDTPISDREIEYEEGYRIDFGKYVEMLVRQWQWIAACALGLGILAFVYTVYSNHVNRSYKASALVASTITASSVDFGSGITTASDIQLAQQTGETFYNRPTRLQSFISQIQNGDIAEQVLAKIGSKLKNEDGTPLSTVDLLGLVSGDLIPKTDTIQITVEYSDPVIAAEIANAWGQDFVQRINALYSSSSTTYAGTQAEVAQAKIAYDKTQAALEDFIARDKTAEYTRKVEEIKANISVLQGARNTVGSEKVQNHLTQLDQAYNDSRKLVMFINNAVSMRAAVSSGGEAAAISNALALTILKTQVYSAFEGSNNLQVQNLPEALGTNISTINAAGMVSDLDALITTLENYHTELSKQIDALSSTAQNEDYKLLFSNDNTPIEKTILDYEQNVRDLNSLIAGQTGTLNELTETRDLAWKSYSALATKATELGTKTQNTQVVFAASATPPPKTQISTVTYTGLAVGVGLIISILIVLAYEFWQNYNGRQPEIISKKLLADVMKLFHRRPLKSQKA